MTTSGRSERDAVGAKNHFTPRAQNIPSCTSRERPHHTMRVPIDVVAELPERVEGPGAATSRVTTPCCLQPLFSATRNWNVNGPLEEVENRRHFRQLFRQLRFATRESRSYVLEEDKTCSGTWRSKGDRTSTSCSSTICGSTWSSGTTHTGSTICSTVRCRTRTCGLTLARRSGSVPPRALPRTARRTRCHTGPLAPKSDVRGLGCGCLLSLQSWAVRRYSHCLGDRLLLMPPGTPPLGSSSPGLPASVHQKGDAAKQWARLSQTPVVCCLLFVVCDAKERDENRLRRRSHVESEEPQELTQPVSSVEPGIAHEDDHVTTAHTIFKRSNVAIRDFVIPRFLTALASTRAQQREQCNSPPAQSLFCHPRGLCSSKPERLPQTSGPPAQTDAPAPPSPFFSTAFKPILRPPPHTWTRTAALPALSLWCPSSERQAQEMAPAAPTPGLQSRGLPPWRSATPTADAGRSAARWA